MTNTTLSDVLNYFKSLAESNVDIAHTSNNPRFCPSWEDFNERVKSMRTVAMVVDEVDGNGAGGNADNNQRMRHIMVWVLKPITRNTPQAELDTQTECEAILTQVLAKMKEHKLAMTEPVLRQWNPNDYKFERVPKFFGNWCGYVYYFNIQNLVDLTVNPAKWQ